MNAATFRALRETTGISQRLIAETLGVEERSVKRWERGDRAVPNDVAEWIEDMVRDHDAAVSQTVRELQKMVKEIDDGQPPIDLTYYRTQAEYDLAGRDEGDYGMVCARARSIAEALRELGYEVEFNYPEIKVSSP